MSVRCDKRKARKHTAVRAAARRLTDLSIPAVIRDHVERAFARRYNIPLDIAKREIAEGLAYNEGRRLPPSISAEDFDKRTAFSEARWPDDY